MKNESVVKLKEAQKLLSEIMSDDDTLGQNVKNVVANALSSVGTCIPFEEVKEKETFKDELKSNLLNLSGDPKDADKTLQDQKVDEQPEKVKEVQPIGNKAGK